MLNPENRKYAILYKNHSNVSGEIFLIYYPCQSKQDNAIKVKNIYILCKDISLDLNKANCADV